jgi:hypothetical protein
MLLHLPNQSSAYPILPRRITFRRCQVQTRWVRHKNVTIPARFRNRRMTPCFKATSCLALEGFVEGDVHRAIRVVVRGQGGSCRSAPIQSMDLALLWMAAILVMVLLGWLACSRFWSYYALFKHLVWGCLALLLGFASYDYGVYRGAWAVRDVYQGAQEGRDVSSPPSDLNPRNNSYAAQEEARVPFLDETIVAGFLMYCVLMLLVGGQIVNNSARKNGSKAVVRDGLFDKDNPRLSR